LEETQLETNLKRCQIDQRGNCELGDDAAAVAFEALVCVMNLPSLFLMQQQKMGWME
jgi:hypothetical protein